MMAWTFVYTDMQTLTLRVMQTIGRIPLHIGKWSSELGVEAAKDSRLVYDGDRIRCSDKSLQGVDIIEGFYGKLGKEQVTPSLHSDNQSAIDLTSNPVYHDRIEHTGVWYQFIGILLKDGVLSVVNIHTTQNLIDMLTKMVT